jgi:hypothetical protein
MLEEIIRNGQALTITGHDDRVTAFLNQLGVRQPTHEQIDAARQFLVECVYSRNGREYYTENGVEYAQPIE